jgi:hypothetical protein
MINSPLYQLLEYPEIKKQFDLTAQKYPMVREWLGWWLKKVVEYKPIKDFDEIDVLSFKWTLTELRKRRFISKNQLYAAAIEIMKDQYRKYGLLAQKKEQDKRRALTHIKELL